MLKVSAVRTGRTLCPYWRLSLFQSALSELKFRLYALAGLLSLSDDDQ